MPVFGSVSERKRKLKYEPKNKTKKGKKKLVKKLRMGLHILPAQMAQSHFSFLLRAGLNCRPVVFDFFPCGFLWLEPERDHLQTPKDPVESEQTEVEGELSCL